MTEPLPSAYPLAWPEGFPRAHNREPGQFKTQLPAALKNVQTSLRLFGADSRKPVSGIVLSSNVTLGAERPSDPGVAAWFTWEGITVCIPVDRYLGVASNLQAIHHILEARRTEMRHGGLAIVRATFAGFRALPPPEHWSIVLGLPRDAPLAAIEVTYRQRAKTAHPDAGGDPDAWAKLQRAVEQAKGERS